MSQNTSGANTVDASLVSIARTNPSATFFALS